MPVVLVPEQESSPISEAAGPRRPVETMEAVEKDTIRQNWRSTHLSTHPAPRASRVSRG
jgi:hypothetical protein